ncbi:hypothetical protein ELS19_18095 [Halogeometricum borinquense]|uniref:Uncharacterized protein n=1 Tax=Halogeometricum borinquense TaxID=60847 RepID=A0A482SZA3_9EURY|nr:hypothetical protein [Halogeometricum borinquense]RYJ08441.1 hypothetical protein ELS19_18095 [Halogeometricum borinquense]
MVMNTRTDDLGIGVSAIATAGSVVLAAYLLFTEVTTLPSSTEPATGLESGNPFILVLAALPIFLSAVGLIGAYYGRPEALAIGGVLLLVLGVLGLNIGFFYLAIGAALLFGYVFTAL